MKTSLWRRMLYSAWARPILLIVLLPVLWELVIVVFRIPHAGKEVSMRRRLAPGVRMYTGDDFNYAELIAGDAQGHSHALLGIFDAIAPAASAALGELAAGNVAAFHDILAPTVPLSRHIFRAPTRFYKTGVVFLAWLNGHQKHFTMVGGQQSARSLLHLAELFRLADAARLLADPPLAHLRMRTLLALHGVEN